MPTADRTLALLGVASVAVSLGGITVAMLVSPWFAIDRHALSLLGVAGLATAPLFNGALLVGGALGAGFVTYVSTVTDHPIRMAALVVLFLATVFMALVGVFPLPAALHGPVAISFFAFLTLGVLLWGLGDYAAGQAVRGAAFVLGAAVHVAVWAWWLTLDWLPPGIAVPELVGSIVLAGWVLWVTRDALAASAPESV
jgi:hypothetical membrane protein